MKKRFIGYHIKQTDELIDSLQNQNDLLAAKINQLALKLNTVEKELLDNAEVMEALEENKNLKLTVRSLEEQLQVFKQENQMLKEKLDKKSVQFHNENELAEDKAFQEIKQIKAQTALEMIQHIDDYTKIIDATSAQMQRGLNDVMQKYQESLEHAAIAINDMYAQLEAIDQNNQLLEDQIYKTTDLAIGLKANVMNYIHSAFSLNIEANDDNQQNNLQNLLLKLNQKVMEMKKDYNDEGSTN